MPPPRGSLEEKGLEVQGEGSSRWAQRRVWGRFLRKPHPLAQGAAPPAPPMGGGSWKSPGQVCSDGLMGEGRETRMETEGGGEGSEGGVRWGEGVEWDCAFQAGDVALCQGEGEGSCLPGEAPGSCFSESEIRRVWPAGGKENSWPAEPQPVTGLPGSAQTPPPPGSLPGLPLGPEAQPPSQCTGPGF